MIRRLGELALPALLVVNVVAWGLLWQRDGTDRPDGSSVVTEPEPPASQERATEERPRPAAGTSVTGYAAGGLLVRAPRVDCGQGEEPVVRTSADEGESWVDASVEGLTSVLAVDVLGDREAALVGTGEDCAVTGWSTTDAGRTWTPTGELPAVWSRTVDDGEPPGDALAPAGPVEVPCTAVVVAGVADEVARVLCRDGRLLSTWTSGGAWSRLGVIEDALDVAYSSSSSATALVRSGECDGLGVRRTTDGGASWTEPSCLAGSADARPVGLAADGASVLVLLGDRVVSP